MRHSVCLWSNSLHFICIEPCKLELTSVFKQMRIRNKKITACISVSYVVSAILLLKCFTLQPETLMQSHNKI